VVAELVRVLAAVGQQAGQVPEAEQERALPQAEQERALPQAEQVPEAQEAVPLRKSL